MTEQQQGNNESAEDVEAHRRRGMYADAEGSEGDDDVEGHRRKGMY
ncbi:MAG: hypothetical protein H0V23_13465 [Nocardioidaceae bacterium]|nr:hypothetical protein [Nocardioidaceae bacterium]